MKRTTTLLSAALCATALSGVKPAQAQSIGAGGGLAGVENFDPVTAAASAHVEVPMSARLSLVAAYAHWFGEDGNRGAGEGTFIGDDGLSLVVLYDLVPSPALQWSVGGGLAQYETEFVFNGGENSDFVGALTLATLLTAPLRNDLSWFLRGEVSAPTGEFQPRWSYVVAGVAIGL